MSVLPLVTVALLLAGFSASVWLLLRSGETRVAILSAMLTLLVIHPALGLWREPARALAFDSATAADAAFLLASLLSLFVVAALWRTLGERDRIESLHWDAMEGVRALGALGDSPSADFDAQLARLLEIGCACFGLEIGMVSRVGGKRYEVVAIRAPASFPVAKGAVFPLEETCCAGVLGAARTLALPGGKGAQPALQRVPLPGLSGNRDRAGRQQLRHAVLREPRAAQDTLYGDRQGSAARDGTKACRGARAAPAGAPACAAKRAARGPERSSPARRRALVATRSVDLNAVLGRVRRQLELAAGPGIELELRAAPDLRAAQDPRLPLDAIVLSLVRNAVDAMPEGGKLTLETANLEVAGGEPGIVPALEPNRYVTLSVRDTGRAIDAGALARVFEPSAPGADSEGRLPLATVYRLLQRCGGDLSVNVEPGRGTDFTVFLPLVKTDPLAKTDPTKPRSEPAAPAPASSAS